MPNKKIIIIISVILALILIGAQCGLTAPPQPINIVVTVVVDREAEQGSVAVQTDTMEETEQPETEMAEAEVADTPPTEEAMAEESETTAMEASPKEVIRFHDGGWQSQAVLNAIAMFIVEHGYGYPTETVPASVDVMKTYLPIGEIDVEMEIWRESKEEWYDAQVGAATLLDLGAIFESSVQGWYVPRYVIEGDSVLGIDPVAPDLQSIEDIVEYKEVFQDSSDPGKGLWVGCIVDWSCHRISQIKAEAYGFDQDFNLLTPEEESDILSLVSEAYDQGLPVLVYHWEPTPMMGEFDMVRLEEPPFDAACWQTILEAADQDPLGTVDEACDYPETDIHTGVYGGLLDRAPDVVIFLKNMFVGTQRVNQLTAYMNNQDIELEDADKVAIYYLHNFENEWRGWVSDDVAERVKAALP
ncbi:MAG: glycine betaine ABC transporter substrate-binding protein [Chloroflexota bacterium]